MAAESPGPRGGPGDEVVLVADDRVHAAQDVAR